MAFPNLPREQLPQIKDHGSFRKWLTTNGIQHVSKDVEASALSPTQHDFDETKIKKIRKNLPEARKKPLTVSKSGHILDGHHRWRAALDEDPHGQFPVLMVNTSIQDLIAKARQYVAD